MTKLLTLKHWQLFGLMVGLPMIFQFATVGLIITNPNSTIISILFPIVIILFTGLFFAWFYALATNLHKKLPQTVTMSLTRFKIFFFVPLVYMLFFGIFMFGMFSNISSGGQTNTLNFALIIPIHLFSMFGIFYCLYFIAKALKSVELQKPVTFSDFAGDFVLIWFFPLGVWIIQPRLNKLFDPTVETDNNQILDHNA